MPEDASSQQGLIEQALACPGFGEALARLGEGLHRRAVRLIHPDRQYAWPCLQGFAASAFAMQDAGVVIVLHDQATNPVFDGQVKTIAVTVPPDAPSGHTAARRHLGLRDCDAVFIAPLRVVSPDTGTVWAGWSPDDRGLLAAHAALNIAHNERHLGLPPQRPSLTETEVAIAELVFAQGPLTASKIVERLPAGSGTSEGNVRRVFSRKLIPHYGFRNPRDRKGYRPPPSRTWA